MNFFEPPSQKEIAKEFIKVYRGFRAIIFDQENDTILNFLDDGSCRFCGQREPSVTFQKRPHLIPTFLGNIGGLGADECDNCNELFSKFESELSRFMSLDRTLYNITNRKPVPSFQNAAENFRLYRLPNGFHLGTNNKGGGITFDEVNNTINIDTSQKGIRPIWVYKAFLKMALATMPKEDLPFLKLGFDYLIGKEPEDAFEGGRFLIKVESNVEYVYPIVFLYKRQIKDSTYPMYVFCLHVRQFMYQLPIFFYEGEFPTKERAEFKFVKAPFLLAGHTEIEDVKVNTEFIDLNGHERTAIHEQGYKLVIDEEIRKNLVSIKMPDELIQFLKKYE